MKLVTPEKLRLLIRESVKQMVESPEGMDDDSMNDARWIGPIDHNKLNQMLINATGEIIEMCLEAAGVPEEEFSNLVDDLHPEVYNVIGALVEELGVG